MKITVEFEVALASATDADKVREHFLQYLLEMEVIEGDEPSTEGNPFWVKNGRLVEPEFEDSDLTGPVGKYWELCVMEWPARVSEAGDLVKVGSPEVVNIIENGTVDLDDKLLSDDWQVMN